MGGGALLELSHEIDLAFYLLRDMQITNSFLTQSGLLDLDVEDHAVLFGHATNCSLITIRLNFCTRPPLKNCFTTLRAWRNKLGYSSRNCSCSTF